MSWLLAGLGKTATDYSTIMRENREREWNAKQKQAMYEREVNLANMKNAQARQLAQEQREWRKEDLETARQYKLEDMATAREQKLEDIESQRAYSKEDRKAMAQEQLDLFEAKASMTSKLAKAEREQVASEYEKVLSEDGSLDVKDQLTILAIKTGQGNIKGLLGSERPMSAEMLEQINEMFLGNEQWDEADAGTKIQMAKAAYNQLTGQGQRASSASNSTSQRLLPEKREQVKEMIRSGNLPPTLEAKIDPVELSQIKQEVSQEEGEGNYAGRQPQGEMKAGSSYEFGRPGRAWYDAAERRRLRRLETSPPAPSALRGRNR